MKMDLNKVFVFIKLTQKFRSVVRDVAIRSEQRFENDMEHSYQFAMFLWYMVSTSALPYDLNKLLKYALIHDLVETYAGDTPALTSKQSVIDAKSKREEHAFKKIMSEIPEFNELEELWNDYKMKKDSESRLVYAIDKVMPVLNEIQQDSGFYKNNKISIARWKKWLRSKLDTVSYFELKDGGFIPLLIDYLEQEKERLFYESEL